MLLRSNDPKDDMNEVRFVDTTLRDGQQSLWALSMKTGMMLPVAEQMDRAGFDAIELMASSHFKKCVRELKDDPWERIRLVAQRIKKTPHGHTSFSICWQPGGNQCYSRRTL
ncbi:MAG: hypothetical protein HYY81_01110 [Deltaproteobacteria bacterium]|nr:hypothetical protein [Deltaproteobacteria bacterium]